MTDDREPYGRLVHDTRLAHEADQAAAEGRARFHLKYWEERTEAQRELDMRIGSAVAARAVHDAGLEGERMRMQLLVLGAHLPAIRRALTVAITDAEYDYEKKDYRNALRAVCGEGGQERGDEDEPASPVAAEPAPPELDGQLALDSISDEKGPGDG